MPPSHSLIATLASSVGTSRGGRQPSVMRSRLPSSAGAAQVLGELLVPFPCPPLLGGSKGLALAQSFVLSLVNLESFIKQTFCGWLEEARGKPGSYK